MAVDTGTNTERAARETRRTISHKLMGGKLNVYRRENSRFWQCSTFMKGKNFRSSTKEESLEHAKQMAEDWFLDLTARARTGTLQVGKSFKEVTGVFIKEYETTTQGHRSPKWVQGHKDRLRLHLLPYFGAMPVAAINGGVVQDYRVQRATKPADWEDIQAERVAEGKPYRQWKPPARNTLHNEVVTLSMVLKTALRYQWVSHLPDIRDPYRKKSKVEHRPWFTPNEYRALYKATRKNAAKMKKSRYGWYAEQLHDYILFMANTGMRPDEAKQLQFRDVEIVEDEWSGDTILEIEVRGKRGVGYCKSMPGAVTPFKRLKSRLRPTAVGREDEEAAARATEGPLGSESEDAPGGAVKRRPVEPTDLVFPSEYKKMLNRILADEELKFDRAGKRRTAYSLRHSYICFRLMEGADIYQIAKNCRTSVEMIEKHYAAHIKDMIDTSLVNVRKSRLVR